MIGQRLRDHVLEISTLQPRQCRNQSANGANIMLDPAQSRALLVLDHDRYAVAWVNSKLAPHGCGQSEFPFARHRGFVLTHLCNFLTFQMMRGIPTPSFVIGAWQSGTD